VVIQVLYGRSREGSFIRRTTNPRTVKKLANHETITAKLIKDRNPSPKQMNVIVIVAWSNIALRGVLSLGLSVPKREGR